MDFPGTINNDFEHFIQHVLDVTRSLAYHGFKKIILLNGHGSNMPNLDLVARTPRWGTRYEIRVALSRNTRSPFRVIFDVLPTLRRQDLAIVAHREEHSSIVRARARELLDAAS